MKKIIIVFSLLTINLVSAFCGGTQQKELVNMQEIELFRIDSIEIRYRSEDIVILSNDSDKLVIKEYMSKNNSRYYAKITHSGNVLVVEAGQRPLGLSDIRFAVNIEVYIPVSHKNITIKTSSGKIEAAGEYTASTMNIESSSGDISVNSITADRIYLKTSSGSINCQNTNGNTTIDTSSGNIVCPNITGDLFAKSSSGRMALGQVSGSLNASTNSGSIHSGTIGGNANIRTSSGDITANGINGNVVAETSSGRVYCTLTENAGDITITTSSGDVTLDIPRNFAFNFSSRSSSGSLRTPFSDKLFSPVSDRDHIQGVIDSYDTSNNKIHKNINIKTNSGSITANWVN